MMKSYYESVEIEHNLIWPYQGSTIGYVVYVPTPTFIKLRMILDMSTLTRTLIFSVGVFKIFNIFLFFIILYCLKTYCYMSKNRSNRFFIQIVLKKPYFSIFHASYLLFLLTSEYLPPI